MYIYERSSLNLVGRLPEISGNTIPYFIAFNLTNRALVNHSPRRSKAQTAVDGALGGKLERDMRDGRSGRRGACLASKAGLMASVECIYMRNKVDS